jgi:hypothetical protein
MNIYLKKLTKYLPDKTYLKLVYYYAFHKKLNLKNPKTYNEKLQWLKLYDRNPLYTSLVDKYKVREYVEQKIGKEYLVPLLGVWNNFDEIDFNKLPNQFVLKCTHDSGGVQICKDKEKFDHFKSKAFFDARLKENFYSHYREWPYKNIKPRIIAEEYMEDEEYQELRDYKLFCFDGEPEYIFIASDRQNKNEETKFDFFDMDFNHLPFINGHPNSNKEIHKPILFEEMKKLAMVLSEGMPHVRVDFYEVNGKLFFGELTFYHFSGLTPFNPNEWDYILGDKISLKNIKS